MNQKKYAIGKMGNIETITRFPDARYMMSSILTT